jgi:hypothetical protein
MALRLGELVPLEQVLSHCPVQNVFGVLLHQVLFILFAVLKQFGILSQLFLPHLINNNLRRIIFLIFLDHLVDLGLSLTILLVRIVIASLGESFIGQIAIIVIGAIFLMLIFDNTLLGLVQLLNIFKLSSMGFEFSLDILKSHIVKRRLHMHHCLLSVFLFRQVIILVQVHVIVTHRLLELLSALVFHIREC